MPIRTDRPSTLARIPRPGTASKSDMRSDSARPPFESRPRAWAPCTTAWANGCSEPCSAAAANRKSSSSETPASGLTSVRVGFPCVTVPVLSRTTVSTERARCRASPFRIRIPCSAALPTATMIEIGVASPRAHGAGDDQYGHSHHHRMAQHGLRTESIPHRERDHRYDHHRGHEVAGY